MAGSVRPARGQGVEGPRVEQRCAGVGGPVPSVLRLLRLQGGEHITEVAATAGAAGRRIGRRDGDGRERVGEPADVADVVDDDDRRVLVRPGVGVAGGDVEATAAQFGDAAVTCLSCGVGRGTSNIP